ncbi:hypothetical protein HMPREF0556_10612 [Listeria grayi DSM 20601]|uniref:Uncharacterized protein n=1 Tax=Listeria grayi DSM 20601 TaxID=525367 RepID=D7UWK1_LISGR|nr:hypothetical protein HMPREF0556_10612 [Listeria grayi DSM 20601]
MSGKQVLCFKVDHISKQVQYDADPFDSQKLGSKSIYISIKVFYYNIVQRITIFFAHENTTSIAGSQKIYKRTDSV